MRLAADPQELIVPRRPWNEVYTRVNRLWEVREAPHMTIIGQTRSGKSYLVCKGILPLCKWDRVLIIDVKGDDRTLIGTGKPVRKLPGFFHSVRRMMDEEKPRQNWFRLVTFDDWDRARDQVGEAFEKVWDDGDWIVVFDELRGITDPQPPGLRLRPLWERFMLRGGSKGIGCVNLSQEPRWLPGSAYTQPAFVWMSRIEDELAQKRVSEIGSSRQLVGHLKTVERHNWIYTDALDPLRFWAMTKVGR